MKNWLKTHALPALLILTLILSACTTPPAAATSAAPAVEQAAMTTLTLVGTLMEPVEWGSLALLAEVPVVPAIAISAGAAAAGAASSQTTQDCISNGGELRPYINPDPRAGGTGLQYGCMTWPEVQASCTQKLEAAANKMSQFTLNDQSSGSRLYRTYTDGNGKKVAEVEYDLWGGSVVGISDPHVATNYVKVWDESLKQGGIATHLLVQAAKDYPAHLRNNGIDPTGMKLLFVDINGLPYTCYWNAMIGKPKADNYLTVTGKNGPEQVPYSIME